jgi:hypothetical protein
MADHERRPVGMAQIHLSRLNFGRGPTREPS